MEIEVGEFVRTNNGIIDEVIKIEKAGSGTRFFGERLEDTIIITNRDILSERRIDLKDIVKHSKNIIDLIDLDDYVNGKRVTDYYFVGTQKVLVLDNEKVTYEENENFVPNLAIKSIITKEQFKSVEYRLEE